MAHSPFNARRTAIWMLPLLLHPAVVMGVLAFPIGLFVAILLGAAIAGFVSYARNGALAPLMYGALLLGLLALTYADAWPLWLFIVALLTLATERSWPERGTLCLVALFPAVSLTLGLLYLEWTHTSQPVRFGRLPWSPAGSLARAQAGIAGAVVRPGDAQVIGALALALLPLAIAPFLLRAGQGAMMPTSTRVRRIATACALLVSPLVLLALTMLRTPGTPPSLIPVLVFIFAMLVAVAQLTASATTAYGPVVAALLAAGVAGGWLLTLAAHVRRLLPITISLLLVAGISAVNGARPAAAGPWTPKAGHGQLIVNVNFYETQESFDQQRQPLRYDFDGRFRKRELNPYLELGLTDRLALLTNLFVSRQEFSNSFGTLSNTGLGDSEFGLRYRLTRDGSPVVFGVQGLAKFATSKQGGAIELANHQFDGELRATIGGSIGHASHPPFWNVDAGYRWRKGGPADEVRVDAALGLYLLPRLMALAQFGGITGMKNNDHVDAFNNPTITPDYDLYRLTGSAVVGLAEHLRLQVGGFRHVAGRNTGEGRGLLVSAWVTF